MKVKVRRFNDSAYNAATAIYNDSEVNNVDDFYEEFTGEIVDSDVRYGNFLICRDDNGKFERVSYNNCTRID